MTRFEQHIFHFPFLISHFSYPIARVPQSKAMPDARCQMTNEK
jgi:hypothetical protein